MPSEKYESFLLVLPPMLIFSCWLFLATEFTLHPIRIRPPMEARLPVILRVNIPISELQTRICAPVYQGSRLPSRLPCGFGILPAYGGDTILSEAVHRMPAPLDHPHVSSRDQAWERQSMDFLPFQNKTCRSSTSTAGHND